MPPYCLLVRERPFGPRAEGLVLFEARVREFPEICTYGDTEDEARRSMADALGTTARVWAGRERGMPEALPPDEGWAS